MGLKVIEWVNERVGVGKSYRATRFARRNERELAVGLGFNIRDLGGYRAGKARFVRSHRFLRAGDTSFLDAEGISILRGYGVSRVLDLRGKLERPELTDVFAKQVGRLFGKELLDRASRMAGSEERLRALHRAVACGFARSGPSFFSVSLSHHLNARGWPVVFALRHSCQKA